jgi:DeoR/GlpR family transcriptional regulator of sugar metabolism
MNGKPVRSYFQEREVSNMGNKRKIAEFVVKEFLIEGDSILLDAGTSLYPIAEEIANKTKQDPQGSHFTIITHNYKAFQLLVEKVPREANLNIVLAGGRYDQDLYALFGPQTIMAYDNFFPRVVLIGVSGIVADQGLFCHGNTEELSVKEIIFKKGARDRIIIADHSKIGVPDALRFGGSANLLVGVERCILITDKPPEGSDPKLVRRFNAEIEKLQTTYKVDVRFPPPEGSEKPAPGA